MIIARLQGSQVVEVVIVAAALAGVPLADMYHASQTWLDVTAAQPLPVVGSVTADGGRTFTPPPGPSAAELQAQALLALAAMASTKLAAGILFQASGANAPSTFATDSQSQGSVTSAYVMAAGGLWIDGGPWEASDGTFVPLVTADVLTLGKAAAGYVLGVASRKAALTAAVMADPTTDISTGWPSRGPFSTPAASSSAGTGSATGSASSTGTATGSDSSSGTSTAGTSSAAGTTSSTGA